MVISNLPNKEFRIMVLQMLTDGFTDEFGRMNKHSENFNKELGNIKEPVTAEEYNNWNEKYARRNQQ